MTTTAKDNIYTLIPKVMAEIGSIGKDQKNSFQGYNFRGIDDVYNAVAPALVKYGVFVVPEVIEVHEEHVETIKGKASFSVRMTVKHTFYAPDGSSVSATTRGEAMDTGDRATSKSHTDAYKQAIFKTFCIPTESATDPERDTHERAAAPAPPPARLPAKKPPTDPVALADFNATCAELSRRDMNNYPLTSDDRRGIFKAASSLARSGDLATAGAWLREHGILHADLDATGAVTSISVRMGEPQSV